MPKPQVHIVKIGGGILEDTARLKALLQDFSALKGPKILVHGGGRDASPLEAQLGIPTTMIDGRRVSSSESLKVVTMMYAGWTNKSIVSLLQSLGVNALGLSGADGNVIEARKRTPSPVDYGYVGDIHQVDASGITGIMEAGFTPVFCAITHDKKGQLLNTNADTIAAAIAAALTEHYDVRLTYCFEKQGVLLDLNNPESLLTELNRQRFEELVDQGVIHQGMLPKLNNCFTALKLGVGHIEIGSESMLQKPEQPRTTIIH